MLSGRQDSLSVRGRAGLVELFGEELWKLGPSLTVLSLVSDRRVVAAELREELTVDERQLRFNIAVFFYVSGGLIHQAKVYREGTADIDESAWPLAVVGLRPTLRMRWRAPVRTLTKERRADSNGRLSERQPPANHPRRSELDPD